MGAFEFLSPDGTEIKITSKKGRALLALICSSENGECSRSWLESILWGRGSAKESLRKELSSLRKTIKKKGEDIFIDKLPKDQIAIDLEVLDVDIISKLHFHVGIFLQGLNIPHEEAFNEWLKNKRTYFSNYRGRYLGGNAEDRSPNINVLSEDSTAPRITIGVLPINGVRNEPGNKARNGSLNDLLDRICKLLLSTGAIDLFDYRTRSINKNITSLGKSEPIKYELVLSSSESLSNLTINAKLIQTDSQKILLLHRSQIDYESLSEKESENSNEYVCDVVDQILYSLKKKSLEVPDQNCPLNLTLDAVNSMFQFTRGGLERAEQNLDLAVGLSRESSIFGWRALFATQKMDDPRVTDVKALKEEALYFTRRAIELDRYNPLTLSLVTHVYSFMFKDFDIAHKYINKAQSLGADHIMTHDAYALLQFYMGDYTKAKISALRSAKLGRLLPFRHLYFTTLCMIESLTGNYQKAIEFGERALKSQTASNVGIYPPTVRYLAANYSTIGKLDKAVSLYQCLPDNGAIAKFLETTDRTTTNRNIAQFLSASHDIVR